MNPIMIIILIHKTNHPTTYIQTVGLRRRRQNAEKYVTDPSQLNLRFARPKTRPVHAIR